MTEQPRGPRTSPHDGEHHQARQTEQTCCRKASGLAGINEELVVASDYVLPDATLSLLADLVVSLAVEGAKTEAA